MVMSPSICVGSSILGRRRRRRQAQSHTQAILISCRPMASTSNVVCQSLLTPIAGIPVQLTRTLSLDRRAWYRTIGTEYAAIALLRPQRRAAAGAIVKEPTSVGRHGLRFGSAAMRARNDGFKDHYCSLT